MKSSLNRHIFFAFSLLLISFSCDKNTQKLKIIKNFNVQDCKIITSSGSSPLNTPDSTFWESAFTGKDEIIVFSFYKPVFIKKIIINQYYSNQYDKIIKIKAYTNYGFAGNFNINNVKINKKVGFIIIKIENTQNFFLTHAYLNNKKYSIGFDDLNKKIAIKNIKFFKDDTTQIFINSTRKNNIKLKFSKNFYTNKIIDYTDNKKSIILKQNGELTGFCETTKADTFYFGLIDALSDKKASFIVNKFIFKDNNFSKITEKVNMNIEKNNIIFDKLPNFRYDFDDDFFIDIKTYDTTIVLDIRYATDSNFTNQQIYDCPFCFMRYQAAKDFKKASEEFRKNGYRIKVFDCYRPHSAQFKLWEILPNINYVANPEKGSIHNRGAAVDMTLIDSLGQELNMGTDFDYFGFKAYSINLTLPDSILNNRRIMWKTMNKYGFKHIKTEWWHLSHYSCLKYPIADFDFPCQ